MFPPPSVSINPGNATNWNENDTLLNTNAMSWREREQQQRTVRVLIMFLFMLFLMDGEPSSPSPDVSNSEAVIDSTAARPIAPSSNNNNNRLRKSVSKGENSESSSSSWKSIPSGGVLSLSVWGARQSQERALRQYTQHHYRYGELLSLNQGQDYSLHVRRWLQSIVHASRILQNLTSNQPIIARQSDSTIQPPQPPTTTTTTTQTTDASDQQLIWHYPWNVTGFYRGYWTSADHKKDKNSVVQDNSVSINETMLYSLWSRWRGNKAAAFRNNVTLYKQNSSLFKQKKNGRLLEPTQLEEWFVSSFIKEKNKRQYNSIPMAGVYFLPSGMHIRVRDDHNLTTLRFDHLVYGSPANGVDLTSVVETEKNKDDSPKQKISLTKTSGRAAIQLYTRSIPGMKEMALVDGFCKLYDTSASSSPFSVGPPADLLMRVRGVVFHGIGRVSLVSSHSPISKAALFLEQPSSNSFPFPSTNTTTRTKQRFLNGHFINGTDLRHTDMPSTGAQSETRIVVDADEKQQVKEVNHSSPRVSSDTKKSSVTEQARRRLLEAAKEGGGADTKALIQHAETLILASSGQKNDKNPWKPFASSFTMDNQHRTGQRHLEETAQSDARPIVLQSPKPTMESSPIHATSDTASVWPKWSDVVIPFPYVQDDEMENLRKTKTPGSRRMPYREQELERNGMQCNFELQLNISPTQWTLGQLRTLLRHKWNEYKKLDPTNPVNANLDTAALWNKTKRSTVGTATTPYRSGGKRKRSQILFGQDQALVVNMVGGIHSVDCQFSAHVNVTALRTDWEATTSMAIHYSFYMMLVCLVQIVLLLRQLLHSQTQSAAIRVSMICIGWQTVLDALVCLFHIYLCLAIQPLFTAFASVAFFKCLIFCVIEMKYMAIIIQARNSAGGGQPSDVLRRQVAVLHLRFYVALMTTFVLLFHLGDEWRTVYMLALYSFWVPQIILNAITQAKMPMHKYYVHGMSLTRLVIPFYVFGIRNNFLRQVYPETPYDPWMCLCLLLWLGFQVAILHGQAQYGARFWIPAQFLPPKYNYSRPIPPSILANARHNHHTSTTADNEASSSFVVVDTTSNHPAASLPNQDRHATSVTTRNRLRTRLGGGGGGAASNINNGNSACQHGRTVEESTTTTAVSTTTGMSPNSMAVIGGGGSGSSSSAASCCLDCSICYESIDVVRHSYMLAPCDHLFHRDCLIQWMDVKMECPICRTELPAL